MYAPPAPMCDAHYYICLVLETFNMEWLRNVEDTVELPFLGDVDDFDHELMTPYAYFKEFITEDMTKYLAYQSMIYYDQIRAKHRQNSTPITSPSSMSGLSRIGRPSKNPLFSTLHGAQVGIYFQDLICRLHQLSHVRLLRVFLRKKNETHAVSNQMRQLRR